jgi:hypothetical protein
MLGGGASGNLSVRIGEAEHDVSERYDVTLERALPNDAA